MRFVGGVRRRALARSMLVAAIVALSAAAAEVVVAAPDYPLPNAQPRAAFTYYPREPRTGQEVGLTSVSSDPDGPIAGYAWDLDNDGQFDDAGGVTASRVFSSPGTHIVRLLVRDSKGATATTSAAITVVAADQPPLQLVSPFTVVRIVGRLVRGGARIRRLSVRAPSGTHITVRCRGRRCPYRTASAPARAGRSVRFRRLQRRFRAGTLVEILVSHPTKIGKYTGFRVRRGRSPRRKDLCLVPGARRGSECPSG